MALRDVFGRAIATTGQLFGLPEMGISERITGQPQQTKPYVYGSAGGAYAEPQKSVLGQQIYNPYQYATYVGPGYAQPKTTVPTGGGVTGGGVPTGQQPSYYLSTPEAPAGLNYEELSKSAWEDLMSSYQAQEESVKAQYPQLKEQAGVSYEEALGESKTAESEEMAKYLTQREEAGKTQKSNIAASRQLYNELRQQRLAELSAGGLSSSSVAEGLLEKLGRNLYQQIGAVRQAAGETFKKIQLAEQETTRDYGDYRQKLEIEKARAVENVTLQFNQALYDIQSKKTGASSALKLQQAQDRLNTLNQYKSQLTEIEKYNSQMRLQLDQWYSERKNILSQIAARTPTTISFEDFKRDYMTPAIEAGYQLSPEIYYSPTAGVSYKATSKKTEEEDLFK